MSKRFRQCPECGEKIFENDEKCMDCGADLAQYRREAEAQWAEADRIASAAAEAAPHQEEDLIARAAEDARIEARMKEHQPAAKARDSANHFEWAAGGSVVLGILGLLAIIGETTDYTLGIAFLFVGIGWGVIFLAGSRLLLCLAELTENVASMARRQKQMQRDRRAP